MRLLIIILLVIIFIPYPIYAQELSFSVSPQLVELAPETPGPLESLIKITNNSEQKQSFDIKLIPFEPSGNSGQINFLNTELPIKDNVAIIDNDIPITGITLRPKESKTLKLYILIPPQFEVGPPSLSPGEAGDNYFSVVFLPKITNLISPEATRPEEIRAYSKIAGGLATNVLLSLGRVKNAQPHLRIVNFSSQNFIEHGPLPISVEIANDGNHFAKVGGEILVTNMLGQTIAKLPIAPQNILSQNNRLHKIVLPDKFLIGSYHIKLNLDLPAQGNRSITFLAIPYKQFFWISLLAAALLFIKKRVARRISR